MDPIEKRELKRKAWMRLAAQRRRAGLLRGRVVAVSMICFLLLWGIVFVQMATGNDPVLSAKQAALASRPASKEIEAIAARKAEARGREREEAAGAEPEFEEATVESEAGEVARAELAETEAAERAEIEAAERAEIEAAEMETLVTSQS